MGFGPCDVIRVTRTAARGSIDWDRNQMRRRAVDEQDWLAERFEERRARLRTVAFRMLGSLS